MRTTVLAHVVACALLGSVVKPAAADISIVPEKYFVLNSAKEALSAHKLCTADEETCIVQDRVIAILMVKDLADPVCKPFGEIGRFFPKGSLSFFVTASEEVHATYFDITKGVIDGTVLVINPYNLDGSKKPGNPRLTVLPRTISLNNHHEVTEWLIRQTLAHVEQFPGDGSQSTKARQLLVHAINWPKITIYSKEKGVPEDIMDAIEDRVNTQSTVIWHVKKKKDLSNGFKEKDFDDVWDKLNRGYLLVGCKDPKTGHSTRVAAPPQKFMTILDQFYADIRGRKIAGPKGSINGVPIRNMADIMDEEEESKSKEERKRKRDAKARKKIEKELKKKARAERKAKKKAKKEAAANKKAAEEAAKAASAKDEL